MAPVENRNINWGTMDNEKLTTMYSYDDIRESTQNKIHSRTEPNIRSKSAGEVMRLPSTSSEGVLKRKSISLSNIEIFFLKRRIPLIKPLISEREIVKLQFFQKQCRKMHSETGKRSLQILDVENEDQKSEEEISKEKARDVATPLVDSKVHRDGDKVQKETEESRKTKIPLSGKNNRDEVKKGIKDINSNRLKSGAGKGQKKERQRSSGKDNTKVTIGKNEKKSLKSKAKTSSETDLKSTKGDKKMNDQLKVSKHKEKSMNSGEKISGEDKSSKRGSAGADKKALKQKRKSGHNEKDSQSKAGREHSKDGTSLRKKSDKSNKTVSSKKSDSLSRKKGEADKDDKEKVDQSEENQSRKTKTSSERFQKGKEDGSGKKDRTKGDNETKPGTAKEKTSDSLFKEKSGKTSGEKKSVKFPNFIQHIIHYVLSNPEFIKLGWTLPPDRAQLQVVTFRAVPNTPHTYCFRERLEDETKYYSKSLDKMAYHFKSEGVGVIFYPSGVPAATITKHETGKRLTLFSDPKNDPLISDSFNSKVLGIFDSFGNGVVYDMDGTKVLNFNQLEGILCSPLRKSPYKWQWCDYKILEKQQSKALLRYMAKEQKQPVPVKKEGIARKAKSEEKKPEVDEAYEQVLAELPYPVVQKIKTKSERQFWGFKPITLKINSEMTLRINGQDDVVINFSSNKVFYRIDLGVKIDPDVVERIEHLAPKRITALEVPCVFDALLDLSPSIRELTPTPLPTRI